MLLEIRCIIDKSTCGMCEDYCVENGVRMWYFLMGATGDDSLLFAVVCGKMVVRTGAAAWQHRCKTMLR